MHNAQRTNFFIETQTDIHAFHKKKQRTHAVNKLIPFILHVFLQIFTGVCGHRYKSSAKAHALKCSLSGKHSETQYRSAK